MNRYYYYCNQCGHDYIFLGEDCRYGDALIPCPEHGHVIMRRIA